MKSDLLHPSIPACKISEVIYSAPQISPRGGIRKLITPPSRRRSPMRSLDIGGEGCVLLLISLSSSHLLSLLLSHNMTFLFDWLQTDSWPSYGLFFFLAIFYQQMERRRFLFHARSENPFAVAVLFRINSLIGCFMTLTTVMSFNVGAIVAIVLGTTIEFGSSLIRIPWLDRLTGPPRPFGRIVMHRIPPSPYFRASSATNMKDAFPVAPACNSFSLPPPTPTTSRVQLFETVGAVNPITSTDAMAGRSTREFSISGSAAVSSGRRPGFHMRAPEFDFDLDDDNTNEASKDKPATKGDAVSFQMSAREDRSSFSPVLGPAVHRHPRDPLPPLELLENKVAAQAVSMQRIAREKQRLAGTHAALRQELFATQQKIAFQQKREKICTDCDIQIGEIIEKNKSFIEFMEKLQQYTQVAQSLISAWQKLIAEIKHIIEEWQIMTEDIKKLQAELDAMRHEHQMLRVAFEYEKGSNMEHVERLHAMEKKLISMARRMQVKEKKLILMSREAEKLRAEVANVEEIASAALQRMIIPSKAPNHLLSQSPSNGFQFGDSANTLGEYGASLGTRS